jgi:lipoprotein-anchoring transpeptidase ErfK/SrfK
VRLDTPLEVTAINARLERATIERIDAPAGLIELPLTGNGARLAGGLEPDARYRLVASAEPDAATPLPWASSTGKLHVERVFDTVRTPSLVDSGGPLLLTRGQPLALRFSEPLAQAQVDATTMSVESRIAQEDPHLLSLVFKDPKPGAEFSVYLTDLRGVDGVVAPDMAVAVRVPDTVRLVSVNGTSGDRVTLPPGAPAQLTWDTPVAAVHYRLGDKEASWTGNATTNLELPVRLTQGQSQTLTIEDVEAPSGGWLASARTFELAGTAPLQLVAFWPDDNAADVSVTGDPTIRFSEEVANSAAAEAAISFEPAVPGRFEWIAPDRVHFLPETSFPADTTVTMIVKGGPDAVRGTSGAYLTESQTVTFTTGAVKRMEVSLSAQTMTLYENDVAVRTIPVATGVAAAPTPPGIYKVQYKVAQARFRGVNPDGSRYDIPDVHWVMPFFGDYTIHGAYWRPVFGRPGSDGCVSMSDANAKVVFDWADVGTPLIVHQ